MKQSRLALAAFLCSALVSTTCFGATHIDNTASKLWKEIHASLPGVYVGGDYLFVYDKWMRSDGNTDEAKTRTIVSKRLANYVLSQIKGISEWEKTLLSAGNYVSISASGKYLKQHCLSDYCEVLFATNKDAVFPNSVQADIRTSIDIAKQQLVRHPERFTAFFSSLALESLYLLNAKDQGLANVMPIRTQWPSSSKSIDKYIHTRSQVMEKLKSQLPILHILALDSCDKPTAFAEALLRRNIKPIRVHRDAPFMRQIAFSQGFTFFDSSLNSQAPLCLSLIQDKFHKGEDSDMVTHLLELAVEEAPRNPVIWEYLCAMYKALGRQEEALLCARVWYRLAEDKSEPFIEILNLDQNPSIQQLKQFLSHS